MESKLKGYALAAVRTQITVAKNNLSIIEIYNKHEDVAPLANSSRHIRIEPYIDSLRDWEDTLKWLEKV